MGNVGIKRLSFCGTSVGDLRSIFKDERALVRGWQCTMHAHIWKSLVRAQAGTWRGCGRWRCPGCAVLLSAPRLRGTALCVVEVFETIFINMIKYLITWVSHTGCIKPVNSGESPHLFMKSIWNYGWLRRRRMNAAQCDRSPLPSQEPACTDTHCTPRPTLREKSFYFSFCTFPGKEPRPAMTLTVRL